MDKGGAGSTQVLGRWRLRADLWLVQVAKTPSRVCGRRGAAD